MNYDDIGKITRELEDLLMEKEDRSKNAEAVDVDAVENDADAEGAGGIARVCADEKFAEIITRDRADEKSARDIARDRADENSVSSYTAEHVNQAQASEEITQEARKEKQKRHERQKRRERQKRCEGQKQRERQKRRDRRSVSASVSPLGLIRPYDGLVAAFLIPVVIMLIIFVQRGIFPFGEESFLRMDMYHQYAPFFSEFRYKLTHGESLLYSWNVGMGINFSALYAYYLASPLNWLVLLCPRNMVIEFMTYMIVFKTGLCGLSMAWYLRRHCRTCDFGIAFFGIFYALSGYMAAYSWNLMWLDCILLFPVIVFGLERLVHEGRGLLYCVALGLSILSNYYISIMTCIFLVLYFFALLVLERRMSWEKLVSRGFQFAVYSLLAGGLAAVVLLPEIYALQMTASGNVDFPRTFTQYFTIFDMIARHIGNVESETGLEHWPNIYCGVAVLIFFVLYLASRRIRAKEKVVYCTLLLFFFASFSFNILNFIWHGFHYPNSLPCRQSYIYIFLVLFMCYRAYMYLEETPGRQVVMAFQGSVVFVLLAQKLVTEKHFHFIVFYVAILFLALYLGVLCLYQKGLRYRNLAILLALMVVSIESAVNMAVTSVTTTNRTSYMDDNEAVRYLVNSIKPVSSFFRMEKVDRKTKNDGAWMNFPSVSLFSSTANADLSELFKKLGCESSTNAYSITGGTPLIDALFAVRYGIYSEENENVRLRTLLKKENETYLYQNNYALPLGFRVSQDFESRWNLELKHPADVQNSLSDATGASQVLSLFVDTTAEGKTLSFFPAESGEYFAYVGNDKIEKVKVTTARGTKTFNNINRGYLIELGYCEAGKQVTLTAEDSKVDMWADIYRFSEDGLAEVVRKLSAEPWVLTSWTEDALAGTISCKAAGVMFTSIPYDEGWTIRVDGQQVTAVKMLDAFIGVNLEPGTHTVEMEYYPEGLKEGMLLTVISLLVLAVMVFVERSLAKCRARRGRSPWDMPDDDGGFQDGDEPDNGSGYEEDEDFGEGSGHEEDEDFGAESGYEEDEDFGAESGYEEDDDFGAEGRYEEDDDFEAEGRYEEDDDFEAESGYDKDENPADKDK